MANELNTSTTKAIYVSTKKHTNNPILKFQNCESDFVSSHKHLGVTFSNNFTQTVYVYSLFGNAQEKLGLRKNLKFKLIVRHHVCYTLL